MAEVPLPSESDGFLSQNGKVPSSIPPSSPDELPNAHLDETLPPQVIAYYEAVFMEAIARQLPIGERDRQTLHKLQQDLGLSDEQVRQINQRLINQVKQTEAHYHQTKIQEYGQKFVTLIEQGWPISAENRIILTQLQAQLQLRDADVQVLEQYLEAQQKNKAAALLANAPINPIPSPPASNSSASNSSASNSSTPTPVAPDVAVPDTAPASDLGINRQATNTQVTNTQATNTQATNTQATNTQVTNTQATNTQATNTQVTNTQATNNQNTDNQNTDIWGTLATEMEVNPETEKSGHSLSLPATELDAPLSELEAIATTPQEPVLNSEREIDYVQLKTYLHDQEWQKADEETLNMMLKITARRVSWLDRQAILELPCTDLKTIDNLWHYYSEGRFGFRIQQDVFKTTQSNSSNVARFGKKVGWTLLDNEYVGFKYYQQLSFESTAPLGHLPAKWFWTIPWWESIRSGGLGTGRGGCGDDAAGMLFAMMYQFVECSSQA